MLRGDTGGEFTGERSECERSEGFLAEVAISDVIPHTDVNSPLCFTHTTDIIHNNQEPCYCFRQLPNNTNVIYQYGSFREVCAETTTQKCESVENIPGTCSK